VTDIVSLNQLNSRQRQEASEVLRSALAPISPAYREVEAAKAEVHTFFNTPERFGFAAVEDGHVVGWIGAIRTYDHGWELHPLCVRPNDQRRGLGTALVRALELAARSENILTLYVGADDEIGATSAFGVDVFADIGFHIRTLEAKPPHPIGFYRRMGFVVIGLMPDVNGPGKPDILLAKRI
jgi:aminoglycoside 6'-N-acetyltransferase I